MFLSDVKKSDAMTDFEKVIVVSGNKFGTNNDASWMKEDEDEV